METKERNDELMELKGQMELLKQQLHKNEIVNEGQITRIARTYKPKHPYVSAVLGLLLGILPASSMITRWITDWEKVSVWELCIFVPFILVLACGYAYMYAGNSYEVKDGQLIVRDVLRRKALVIPTDKIRFVEFMASKGMGAARIMYNRYDDLYLRNSNYTELIKDLLRANPDIEIRREMA